MTTSEGVRLQKVLAASGVGSRRYAEILIDAGRVKVNGEVVRVQGLRVNPETDIIHVDGVRVVSDSNMVVFAFNKPVGVHTTMSDDQGRACVGDYTSGIPQRVFHVGRLDAQTSGLLLLTNDGELTKRLTHPSHGILKTYVALVAGKVTGPERKQLLAGVPIDGREVQVHKFTVKQTRAQQQLVELAIHEGRNHIVRRLLADVGHPVLELTRTTIGPVTLGGLRPGKLRQIEGKLLRALYTEAGL